MVDISESRYSPADFWGEAVWSEGHAAIPRRLLANAAGLGLDAVDQALLVHLLSFKMTEAAPWPSVATLAGRLKLSESAVRRRLRRLEKGVRLIVRDARSGLTNQYNLRPLASALRASAPVVARARREGVHPRTEGASHQEAGTLGASDHRTRTTQEDEVEKEQTTNAMLSLRREGVRPSVALRLVHTHGEAACLQQAEWLPYRPADDKAAVLVASIQHGYGAPKDMPDLGRRR